MKQNPSEMKKEESGFKILIVGNKCYRCEYEWRPRDVEEKPRVCPNCKNPYWDKPRKNKDKK